MVELLPSTPQAPGRVAVVGRGRLGSALAPALRAAGLAVDGPLGRDSPPARAQVVLLCVPDRAIPAAAAAVAPGPLVGHLSGATGLGVLAPHEGFGLHPLMTVARDRAPAFAGAGAGVAGTTPRALAVAETLARALGMRPFPLADEHRAAYHAAASLAANGLVALAGGAERLAATAGVERALLVPLVRAAVESWAALGPREALTGPIARGDVEVVARQREAVAQRAPDLLPAFDAFGDLARGLATG